MAMFAGYAETKVACAPEVGWEVLAILEETEPVTWSETEHLVVPGMNLPQMVNNTRGGVGKVCRFLLGRKRDSVLDGLHAKVEELEGERERLKLERSRLERDKAELEQSLVGWKNAATVAEEKLVAAKQSGGVLEESLSKVRQAIGELRYNEIVAAKKP